MTLPSGTISTEYGWLKIEVLENGQLDAIIRLNNALVYISKTDVNDVKYYSLSTNSWVSHPHPSGVLITGARKFLSSNLRDWANTTKEDQDAISLRRFSLPVAGQKWEHSDTRSDRDNLRTQEHIRPDSGN